MPGHPPARTHVPSYPYVCMYLYPLQRQVVVVGFPATPLLTGRTRICISAGHTREDLEHAVEKLEEVADKCFLRYSRSAVGY